MNSQIWNPVLKITFFNFKNINPIIRYFLKSGGNYRDEEQISVARGEGWGGVRIKG